eukprot:5436904-Amphidinium_carterae.2
MHAALRSYLLIGELPQYAPTGRRCDGAYSRISSLRRQHQNLCRWTLVAHHGRTRAKAKMAKSCRKDRGHHPHKGKGKGDKTAGTTMVEKDAKVGRNSTRKTKVATARAKANSKAVETPSTSQGTAGSAVLGDTSRGTAVDR